MRMRWACALKPEQPMRRGRAAPARAQIGVDDMDVFKGIELKLAAYECLLNAHPELHGKVSLIQARPPACARCPLADAPF